MTEISASCIPEKPQRLEYAAVPLEPWSANYPGEKERYETSSRRHIRRKLGEGIVYMLRHDWLGDVDTAVALHKHTEASLLQSHITRIDRNSDRDYRGVDKNDPRLELAKEGLATPSDLLGLLIDYPQLESLELAKLSHPFDHLATEEMDLAIAELTLKYAISFLYAPARYKRKLFTPEVPALTLLRKQPVLEHIAEDGRVLHVVRRQSYLVRGDEHARIPESYIDRQIKNPERFKELQKRVEGYISAGSVNPDLKWLQPIATSYYGKWLNADPATTDI